MKRIEELLLFLTLLFLPTQLGRHFWPEFSFIYSLPIDYLSPTIYFWDLLVICLMLVFLFRQKKVNKTALNIFLLFILSQIISLIPYQSSGLNLGAGLVRAEQYLISGLFGIYIASKNVHKVKFIFIWGLGLAILGQSILAILQFLKEGTIGLWILGERTFSLTTPGIAKFDFYGREFLRPYGTFPHPNVLAAFLILTSIMLCSFARLRIVKMAIFFAGVVTLLTVSRTAIVAGLVAGFWLFGKKGQILLFLMVIALLPVLYTRFSSSFNFDNLSILRREQLSEVSLKMFSQAPFIGVGLNNFIPAAADQVLIGPSRFLQPVHNIFLLALSETGILGLVGFLGFAGYPIWRLTRKSHSPLFLVWVIMIFLGMFDHYFLTLPQGYRLLFLLWGISLSGVK